MQENRIVTFLSDFGTADGYVGSVKGVIKSLAPQTDIIDISHDIKPFNITGAAYTLLNYYQRFPKDTIHLVVVDPGVGSERRPVILRTAHYFFIGPDNGIFQYIYSRKAYTAYEIDLSKTTDSAGSHTFHGRDIFAPAAAQIAKGTLPHKLGNKLDNRTETPNLMYTKEGVELALNCISIDRFGNIITGFSKYDLARMKKDKIVSIRLKNFQTDAVNKFYAEKESGEILALWNSQDFLEIAVCRGSAENKFNFNSERDKIFIKVE